MSSWQQISIYLDKTKIPKVSQFLDYLGTTGIEEKAAEGEFKVKQPWDLITPQQPTQRLLLAYFDMDDSAQDRLIKIQKAFPDLEISSKIINEGDWEETWRTLFVPFQIGDHTIAPPWNAPAGSLIVEPGMAFGTGNHPTTKACLDAVARLARPNTTLLDVGCGSGILALLGAKLGATTRGIDIDPESIRASKENADLNTLTAIFDNSPLSSLIGSYNYVIANVYAEILVKMATDLKRLTDNTLFVAGILEDRAYLVEQALQPFVLVKRIQDGEWVSMEWRKP